MSAKRPRYITGPDAATHTQLEAGLKQAMSLFAETAQGLLMTFTTKINLDNVTPRLAALLGQNLAYSLWAIRDRDVAIKVMAERDSSPFTWRGPVLMVYPNAKMLNRVGDIRDVSAEIVVPWTADGNGIEDWVGAWSPDRIGTAVASNETAQLSPQTRVALHSLTTFVNFNNRLVTKDDREEAINVFETLLAFDRALNKAAVRAWLVSQEGWPGDVADAAMQILNDLAAGKQLRGRRGPDKASYDWWCEQAAKEK